jgi:Phosphodiester glycosidase
VAFSAGGDGGRKSPELPAAQPSTWTTQWGPISSPCGQPAPPRHRRSFVRDHVADQRARGWQYRLHPIEDVVEREHLAVAINGTYFTTASGSWLRLSGDLARSMQTLISDHVIAYGLWGASLLWFDAELAPHVLQSSSAAEPVLTRAKWAVGAHVLQKHNGQVLWGGDSTADARTAIGIDQPRKLLFLAISERISQPCMLHVLADLGARDGFLLDGGRLERNGDRTGQHRDSSHRIVGGRSAGGYLHRCAGAAMPQPRAWPGCLPEND